METRTWVQKYSLNGTREQIQESASQAALVMLWNVLAGNKRLECG